MIFCSHVHILYGYKNHQTCYCFRQNQSHKLHGTAMEWFPTFLRKNVLPLQHHASTRKLCFTNRGRLGNKMFQFSAVYNLAKYYGRHLVIDEAMHVELTSLFRMKVNNSQPYITGSCAGLPSYINLKTGYQDYFLRINDSNDIRVDGYFESWKYFYHNFDDIKEMFTLHETMKAKAKSVLLKHVNNIYSNKTDMTYIGIQVRRGDIAEQQKEASWAYFQQAMDYYRHKYKNVHFFVASNQLGWCKYHFRNVSAVSILTGSAVLDMSVLSQCDHSIMSVATYSWWCSMLAGGEVNDPPRMIHNFFPASDFY